MFIAIPLSSEARDAVAALVASLPVPDGRPVRWVRFDGLHLTIRFLGPTPTDRLAAVDAAVAAVAADEGPFTVSIRGAGAFPNLRRPRALWLGVDEGTAELSRLGRETNAALAAAGWAPDDRTYRPHLTLARSDGVRAGAATAAALIAAAAALEVRFTADRLVLFESLTGGGPARYEPIVEHRLAGASSRSTAAGA
ncbi:MAG TPA: RNA 2',3'-cyclic phosphodiesterase [Candidatus Limnocylindrales bacterium]|nr:RNA 2',3'-cyclic phosphodiesterase [Candidatus Limnocylindrales bacterium]